MDAFEDFWSSSGLGDLPSADEELEQERAGARRDREWLLEQFGEYSALADELADIVTESTLDGGQKRELLALLDKVRSRLMQEPVRLLVLGASSAGKSTLVNALAGRVVSPEAQHSSTLIPAWIHAVDRDLNGEVAYNILKRGMTKKYMARPSYLKMYCHPPEDKNTNPDDYAVIAEVEGGFLADSGLMLLDTPGVDQTDADTDMTVRTADLGAEMVLMIIRSNVFSQQETALYKKLFPGGELDLGLDVHSDVFSVYNVMPGNPDPPSNVVDSIREMTDGKLDTNARLYSIDMLQERQRSEPYRYYDWAPLDIGNEEEIQKLKKDQSREKHGYTVGASQRPYGYDLLKGTPPGPEMKRLTDDLCRRAWALCAEKQRICVPILDALCTVGSLLTKGLEDQFNDIVDGASKDAYEIEGHELRTYSPRFDALMNELDDFDKAAEEIKQAQQALSAKVDEYRDWLGKAADSVLAAASAKNLPTASKLFENIDMSLAALRKDPAGLARSVRGNIRDLCQSWQKDDLLGEFLLRNADTTFCRTALSDGLAGLGSTYNDLANRVQTILKGGTFRRLDPEKAVPRLMKKYDRGVCQDLAGDKEIDDAMRDVGSAPIFQEDTGPAEVPDGSGTAQTLASRMTNWILDKGLLSGIRQKATSVLLQVEKHDLAAFTDGIRAFAGTLDRSDYIAALRQPPFTAALEAYREKLWDQGVQAAQDAYEAVIEKLVDERSSSLQASLDALESLTDTVLALKKTLAAASPGEVSHSGT